MKRKIIAIFSICSVLAWNLAVGQDFILNNATITSTTPPTFPDGKISVSFDLFHGNSTSYNFSSDDGSNFYATVTISFTKLDPRNVTPSGSGADLFNWVLTDNGGTGAGLTYTWTGKSKDVQMAGFPTVAKYKIVFQDVPVTLAATQNEADIRITGQFTPPPQTTSPTDDPANNSTFVATYSTALPVNFGPLQATFNGSRFAINWQTTNEKNNKEFLVQASTDGENFHTIGTVASQAENGNSDKALNYTFSRNWDEFSSLLGFPLISAILLSLFIVGLVVKNRRKAYILPVLALLAFTALLGCQKDEEPLATGDVPDVYVRIAQVNIDGGVEYTNPVKAVKE